MSPPVEAPPKPMTPEAKPAAQSPAKDISGEKPLHTSDALHNARGTLEEIAKGMPVKEATASKTDAPAKTESSPSTSNKTNEKPLDVQNTGTESTTAVADQKNDTLNETQKADTKTANQSAHSENIPQSESATQPSPKEEIHESAEPNNVTSQKDASQSSPTESAADTSKKQETDTPKTAETPIKLDQEKITEALSQANSLLLDTRDPRILISAIATRCVDTPLGNETRIGTLKMIEKMSNADMSPTAVIQLDAVKKQIADLKLPDINPAESALIPVITRYNEAHPDKAVPTEVINQIKSGNRDAGSTVAQLLQTDTQLAGDVWKELTGIEGFTGLQHIEPGHILDLAGIPQTKENVAKANEIFGKVAAMPLKEEISFGEGLQKTVMAGGLLLMFFTQIISDKGGGGH